MHDVAAVRGSSPSPDSISSGRTIPLTPAEFWRLRALARDVEAIELEFARIREDFTRRSHEAVARRDDVIRELSAKYGFPLEARYTFDDETCSVREA